MNFQVNGQDYFLAFSEDEGRWYLLAPTPEGAQRIPVYVDVAKYALSSLRDVEPQTKLSS